MRKTSSYYLVSGRKTIFNDINNSKTTRDSSKENNENTKY